MRTQSAGNESPRLTDKAVSRRQPLTSRIDRLLREMAAVVPIQPLRWKEPLRVLLTHPQPPAVLQDFHKSMRAAVRRARYDDVFVDRLLAALAAAERASGLGELLAPIQLTLLSFIGGISRRPSVLMTTVSKFVGGTDIAAPMYLSFSTFDRKCRSLSIGNVEAMTNITVAVQQAVRVLLDELASGASAFAGWKSDECLAGLEALWLAYTYCEVGTAKCGRLLPENLRRDFERFGSALWKRLDACIGKSPSENVRATKADRVSAFGRLVLSVEASERLTWSELEGATALSGSSTHIVCRSAIPDSSDKQDIQEISRHRVLEQPLPVSEMPSLASLNDSLARLLEEFPWASAALCTVFDDLLGRANLRVRDLTLPATLLIGRPGGGKSRLARRIAEELGLPRLDVSLSGTSDTKLLGGSCCESRVPTAASSPDAASGCAHPRIRRAWPGTGPDSGASMMSPLAQHAMRQFPARRCHQLEDRVRPRASIHKGALSGSFGHEGSS